MQGRISRQGRFAGLAIAAACSLLPAPGLSHDDSGRDPALADREHGHRRGSPTLFARELEDPSTLGVGRVGVDVAQHLPEVQALSSHLQGYAEELGVARVLPVVARDDDEMADFLRRGIVDLVSHSSMPAMHYVRDAGASVLLLERRDGESNCAAVLLTRTSSAVRRVEDLRGGRIALDRRGSTTSFQLPLLLLHRAGLVATELDFPSQAPPMEGAGYFFVRSETSVLELVATGDADAGAVSAAEWKRQAATDAALATGLRVLEETETLPCALAVVGPALGPRRREALRRVLLAMSDDKVGRDVLERYGSVDRFEPVDADTQRRLAGFSASWETLAREMGR